jgi:acyl dehydratase
MVSITRDTKIGEEFHGKIKIPSEPRVYAFSGGSFLEPGWPKKNIHTSLEFAKECGLETRAISGTQMMGYIVELMIDLFGEGWLSGGKMNIKFIKPVDVGTKLIAKAIVKSKEKLNDKVRFILDIWCERDDGTKVAVGTAEGQI